MAWFRYRPYVSVSERRRQATRQMDDLRKKGVDIQPIEIAGRRITHTFWGTAWCEHLESFSDFKNRLPRGRTYVRNGSVCHLAMTQGLVEAKVMGSELYDVRVRIKTLSASKWEALRQRCLGQIGSLLELLQGELSENVMGVVTDRENGLFPLPGEIELDCSCPDWATMCKHVAAALYGVGARLDEVPSLLFELRGVNHADLIDADAALAVPAAAGAAGTKRLESEALGDVFGIDIDSEPIAADTSKRVPNRRAGAKKATRTKKKSAKKKSTRKKSVKKKAAGKKSTRKKAAARKAAPRRKKARAVRKNNRQS